MAGTAAGTRCRLSVTLSIEELSAEAGVPAHDLRWLTDLGILKPRQPGRYVPGDILRSKMVSALLDAGFTREHVEWAASEGKLNLDHVDHYMLDQPTARSPRTFADFLSDLDPKAAVAVPAIYQVLGLPEPDPASHLRVDEEQLLEQFLEGWSIPGDDETPVRAARLVGEGTRMAAVGWPALLDEKVARDARERFLRGEVEAFPRDVIRTATLVLGLLPRLMGWLAQRYVEQVVAGGIVDSFEAILATAGLAPPPEPTAPPAVVFADVSGYTSLTERRGDEAAVRIASSLQKRAEEVATRTEGRLVKLLGDGAMLYFREPGRGVDSAVELVRALTSDLGISAHAGVHVGPVVERDRDLYGRTVNLAARLAGVAGPGEVIVTDAVVRIAGTEGRRFEPLEQAELKGFADPVPLFRVVVDRQA